MKTRDSCFLHAGMDLKAGSSAMDALARISVSIPRLFPAAAPQDARSALDPNRGSDAALVGIKWPSPPLLLQSASMEESVSSLRSTFMQLQKQKRSRLPVSFNALMPLIDSCMMRIVCLFRLNGRWFPWRRDAGLLGC